MQSPIGLFDVASAAAYLRLRPSTLDKWRTQGRGPHFVKLGGAVRYRLADLESYVAANTVASTAEVVAK